MKLQGPINLALANTLRGHVDVYYWHGVPVARKWPNPIRTPASAGSQEASQKLADAMNWLTTLSTVWRKPWQTALTPHGRTYQDIINTVLLKLTYAGRTEPLPVFESVTVQHKINISVVTLIHAPGPGPDAANITWRIWSGQLPRPQLAYLYQSYKKEAVGKRLRAFRWDWSQWSQENAGVYNANKREWKVGISGVEPFVSAVPFYTFNKVNNVPLSMPWMN